MFWPEASVSVKPNHCSNTSGHNSMCIMYDAFTHVQCHRLLPATFGQTSIQDEPYRLLHVNMPKCGIH